MKLLAIDYGEKRVGVAVGDTETKVAVPLPPFQRRSHRQALGEIQQLLEEYGANAVVVGYPLLLDGTPSPTTEKVDHFISFLRRRLTLPVETADERLTSFDAEQMLSRQERDFRKRKEHLDSVSAQLILQGYLER
jgi:putative holliday junction resolvase